MIYFSSQFKGTVHNGSKVNQQELDAAGHMTIKSESDECLCSGSFLFFMQTRTQGLLLPTF